MKCGDCKFYSAAQSRQSALRPVEGVGECRRNAPRGPVALAWSSGTDDGTVNRGIMSAFPFVPDDDWCGEFRASTDDTAPLRERIAELEATLYAVRGNVTRVTLQGQVWVRHDVGSPEHELSTARAMVAALTERVDVLEAALRGEPRS